jgi:hypothetical protein
MASCAMFGTIQVIRKGEVMKIPNQFHTVTGYLIFLGGSASFYASLVCLSVGFWYAAIWFCSLWLLNMTVFFKISKCVNGNKHEY